MLSTYVPNMWLLIIISHSHVFNLYSLHSPISDLRPEAISLLLGRPTDPENSGLPFSRGLYFHVKLLVLHCSGFIFIRTVFAFLSPFNSGTPSRSPQVSCHNHTLFLVGFYKPAVHCSYVPLYSKITTFSWQKVWCLHLFLPDSSVYWGFKRPPDSHFYFF